jgi:hypothetical protein
MIRRSRTRRRLSALIGLCALFVALLAGASPAQATYVVHANGWSGYGFGPPGYPVNQVFLASGSGAGQFYTEVQVYNANCAGLTVFQSDGNLVEYGIINGVQRAMWSSQTNGHPSAQLFLQTDHNVVIRDPGGVLWASGTQSSDSYSHWIGTDNTGHMMILSSNPAVNYGPPHSASYPNAVRQYPGGLVLC